MRDRSDHPWTNHVTLRNGKVFTRWGNPCTPHFGSMWERQRDYRNVVANGWALQSYSLCTRWRILRKVYTWPIKQLVMRVARRFL